MSPEVARILRAAADLLEKKGWTPYLAARDRCTGPFCAVEAVSAVTVERGAHNCHDAALMVLRDQVGTRFLGEWNDSQPGPDPVIAALRAAADRVERT